MTKEEMIKRLEKVEQEIEELQNEKEYETLKFHEKMANNSNLYNTDRIDSNRLTNMTISTTKLFMYKIDRIEKRIAELIDEGAKLSNNI